MVQLQQAIAPDLNPAVSSAASYFQVLLDNCTFSIIVLSSASCSVIVLSSTFICN